MGKIQGATLLYSVACFASLGQFLFGYDQGVMSGILVNESWLAIFNQPNATMQGLVVAIFELGAWFTAYPASWVMDTYGRKWTIMVGSLIFIVGGVLQTAAVYTAELSRAHNRGRVTVLGMSVNMFGYMSSAFIDYGFSFLQSEWSFRGPLLLQCVFAVILAAGCLALPESPRFLVTKEKNDAALQVLANLHGKPMTDPTVCREHNDIIEAVTYERTLGEASWLEMLTVHKRRSFIAIAVQAFGQLQGINIVTYYAPKMYETVLGKGNITILFAGFTALVYFVGALVAAVLVDKAGRRPLFMGGSLTMIVWLILMAVFNKVSLGLTSAILVIVFTMIYVFTFGVTWACLDWLYPAEIFPMRTRAKGMSLAVSSNWLCNFAVGLWTPPLLEKIGWATYLFYAAWCLVALVVVYFTFVETKGKSLEEIDEIFGCGKPLDSTSFSSFDRSNDSMDQKTKNEKHAN